MEKLIYLAMSGANRMLHAQQVRANNMANAATSGFRADIEVAGSQAVAGFGFDSSHMVHQHPSAVDARAGTLVETGRELDLAIEGEGFFAIATEQGEAYTRAGNLTVDAQGALTVNGHPLLGDSGQIVLPPFVKLDIAADGTILLQAPGESEGSLRAVDQIKLVNPLPQELSKDLAGRLVSRLGGAQPVDQTVRVLSGHLENSNVSAVEEMIASMKLSRGFEIQMKMFSAASDMVEVGHRLMRG